jgi:superfamily II DNA or RNA helicase
MAADYLELPPRWARSPTIEGNDSRQLIALATSARLVRTNTGQWRVELPDGTHAVVRERGRTPSGANGLELSREDFARLPAVPASVASRWITREGPSDPADVRSALEGRFTLRIAQRGSPGLRIPQAGAMHAALAHWSTESLVPATIVLPTGTGKTETMIALLASERLQRVLVLVPTDSLRRQIAEAFETFGVLPHAGVLETVLPGPVVGRLAHRLTSAANARAFADRCNVIVTTPSALPADDGVFRALVSRCSHLFVDEAHHIAASSWSRVRDAFADRPVLQFTATPYRADGVPLGGRIMYSFPLGLAQRLGYFQKITYISIASFAARDRAVATEAVAELQRDRAAGFDHLIMARVRTIARAGEVLELYEELAPELGPCALHSELDASGRHAALQAIRSRQSRIVVCVDMLGEGFDFPELKVAALHDPHRSLGVALQFIGRFARSRSDLGSATAVVARPDPGYDERLRALYAEGNEWDEVIEELATQAVEDVQALDTFEAGFGQLPQDELSIQALRPKMSTVAYETDCSHCIRAACADCLTPRTSCPGRP